MRGRFSILFACILVCLLALPGCTKQRGKTYYFDSSAQTGGDGSARRPFSELSALSSLELSAGDTVKLKGEFKGGLRLVGISGAKDAPITVTSYGDTMSKIDGDDLQGEGVVYIENCNYLTVEGLEICDSAEEEGDRRGVLVNAVNPDPNGEVLTFCGITLRGLYIHHIRGYTDAEHSGMAPESKATGGIHVWSETGRCRFDGLTVTGCRITDIDNAGIATWYMPGDTMPTKISPYSEEFPALAHTHVTISENEISYIGKNAIFVRNLMGGVIERNRVFETALRSVSGNQIVTCYVWGTVIQSNEGYLNRARVRESDGALHDGCMLDADLESRDTVWQYNYSHDNAFGLFLNCTKYQPENGKEDRAIVRYNLSVADKGANGIIFMNYESAGLEIYNNTIVTAEGDAPIILQTNRNRKYAFYNNLIVNRSQSAFIRLQYDEAEISHNLIYNMGGSVAGLDALVAHNAEGLSADPWFAGEFPQTLEERCGMRAAQAFRLAEGSCALSAGIATEAERDFFGNPCRPGIGFDAGEI